MSLTGHAYTLRTRLRHAVRPPRAVASLPWQGVVADPAGPVRLTGRLSGSPEAQELVLVVHGLGGSAESAYAVHAAAACAEAGVACLRLNLRGADLSGEDFYHAGLTADLHAAAASPELRRFARLHVLGYSIGGHTVLRYACEPRDPRVGAVAAVCSPLDLARSAAEIDRPERWPYRRYVLRRVKRIYAAVAARRPVPTPLADALRISTFQEWDRRTVAPRHGFRDEQDYYRRESVGPRLGALGVPALLVAAEGDPMVPPATIRDAAPPPGLRVVWTRGGHVGFPATLDLGLGAPGRAPLAAQVLSWFRAVSGSGE